MNQLQRKWKAMRLDQDINFEVGGVPCVMALEMVSVDGGDLFYIKPRNEEDPSFGPQISAALTSLMELGASRQRYDSDCRLQPVLLLIEDDDSDECTLASGIVASLPDWDGNSFDFFGSQRLARLLADLKDAMPGIEFRRSNGSIIEYEEFIEHGGDPLSKMLDDFDEAMEF